MGKVVEKLDKAGLFMELKMVMPKVRKGEGTETKPFIAGNETKIAKPFVAGNKPFAAEGTAHRSIIFEKVGYKMVNPATRLDIAETKPLIEVVPETAERITKACKAARSRELGSLGQGWMEGFGE